MYARHYGWCVMNALLIYNILVFPESYSIVHLQRRMIVQVRVHLHCFLSRGYLLTNQHDESHLYKLDIINLYCYDF